MQALSIKHLGKTYKEGFSALSDINLTVQTGDFFALLGPNGAGKTTLINILASLTPKTQGQVRILGHDIDIAFQAAKSCIGLVPQECNFSIFDKVLAVAITEAGYHGLPKKLALVRAEKYLKQLHLWEKRKVKSRALSGGMKRLLMLVRALVHAPKLLILDEPTAGVDVEIRRSIWDFLRKLNQAGTTIILTTHYLEEAENLCNRIAILNKGKIIEDTQTHLLLDKLTSQAVVLHLDSAAKKCPHLAQYALNQVDPLTLEAHLSRGQYMSHLLAALSEQGIIVKSVRNKTNPLEALFVKLIEAS